MTSYGRIKLNNVQIQAEAEIEYRRRILLQEKESEEKRRYEDELAAQNEKFGTFRSYISNVNPHFVWYKHCIRLANVLQRVADGEILRLLVFEPPRHGKSEEVTRLFPGYYQWLHKNRQIGITTHSDSLSFSLSRKARDYYLATGRSINQDASSPREWHTQDGGITWAVGRGGSITGKGADLLLFDDLIKGHKEAESEKIRRDTLEWYDSDFYTRLEPGGAIVGIQTRWHEGDIAGELLAREEREPEHWHIVNYEAIKEKDTIEFPSTCTIEPDWRKPGEALCPERYDKDKLIRIKNKNPRIFVSLYQQRPTASEGNTWKREWFKKTFVLGKQPKLNNIGTDWDTAFTKNEENAATAYVESGISDKGNVFILDVGWKWLEFPEQVKWIARKNAPHYIEAKATGKSAKQVLRKNNIAAYEVQVDGGEDKVARTNMVIWIAEEGRIRVAEHVLDKLLDDPKQGILRFPNGKYKDLNDAFVQALTRLVMKNKEVSAEIL